MSIPQYGVLPISHDTSKNLTVGAALTLPKLSALPERLYLSYDKAWILEQAEDSCAGHASSLTSSFQEGIRLDPIFTWIMARNEKGMNPDDWGCDLQSIADAHRKIGALPLSQSPFYEGQEGWRDPDSWDTPINRALAIPHRKGGYLWVERTQGYDLFDVTRAMLFKLNIPIMVAIRWPYGEEPFIEQWEDGGIGHAIAAVGYEKRAGKDYLIIVNSWGRDSGNDGEYRIAREVINKELPIYGGLTFVDETPEKIREYIGKKLDDSQTMTVIKKTQYAIIEGLKRFIRLLQQLIQKEQEVGYVPSKYLLPALCWKESNFDANAHGDLHLSDLPQGDQSAWGILQIRPDYMQDAIGDRNAKRCKGDVALSIKVYKAYMARYAREKRLGRPVTDEDYARIHNGGPTGWKRPTTVAYWLDVKKKMELIKNNTAPQWVYQKIKQYNLL